MARAVRISWRGARLKKNVRAHVGRQLDLAAEVLKDQIVRNISRSFWTYGASKGGAFPHARQGGRGGLLSSIFWTKSGQLARTVGTTKKYGFFLEVGTSKMAARPWLRRTLRETWNRLKKIIMKPMPPAA